jgi:uncharacterized protein
MMMSLRNKPVLSHWQRFAAIPLMIGMMSFMTIDPVSAQEKQLTRTLTVSGRGFEDIQTTLSQVRLGVEAQGKTAQDVQAEVARRSNSVVSLLKSRQVERLETTGINLNPVYDYSNNRQRIIGYAASNVVSFRIPTDKAGTILDDSVKAGASRIDGVNFMASDDAIATAQKQALRKATQDAQDQANAVFSALNLTRKEIVNIQINNASPPAPVFMEAQRVGKVMAADAPSPVMGGQQRIEAAVTLQISY